MLFASIEQFSAQTLSSLQHIENKQFILFYTAGDQSIYAKIFSFHELTAHNSLGTLKQSNESNALPSYGWQRRAAPFWQAVGKVTAREGIVHAKNEKSLQPDDKLLH
jgi:hypothetical protein